MFWSNVLILNLMIPAIMLGMGGLYLIKPPKNRNFLYGYCSRRSTKSQETWEFAQKYFGSTCCIRGSVASVSVSGMMLMVLEKGEEIIRTLGSLIGVAEGIIMVSAFLSTEWILKKKFGI